MVCAKDAVIFEVARLGPHERKKYTKPWVVIFPNKTHLEFLTEGSAHYSQRYYRREEGLDEWTGEAIK